MRRVLHIDMDAFFAAVEQLRRPELVGKPVVVGGSGDPSKRGVVSTASYEARAYGIHSAMPMRTAYQRCPHAVFLAVDFRLYREASRRVKEILRGVTPHMESGGLDEAYLDISEVEGTSETIGRAIQERILAETRLTCSIGIAPTKMLAKIASDMEKPSGLTILTPDDLPSRVWPLGVRKLIGVGPKTEARLVGLGIKTIGDLANLSADELAGKVGKSYATYLHEAAWGRRDSPVVTSHAIKSISRETTFQDDLSDPDRMLEVLKKLTVPVVRDLERHDLRARTVSVKLRHADFRTWNRQVTLERPSRVFDDIWRGVQGCFERFDLSKPVRLLGVAVKGFETLDEVSDAPRQEELGL